MMIQVHISDNTALMTNKENNSKSISLNIGSKLIATRFFSDFPPSYDEIDQAINFTEEEIMKYQHHFDGETILQTNDIMAKQIAALAFNTNQQGNSIAIPRVELENVFNRLADIVKGLPASQDVLPDSNEFAAYLLVLREIMHHLNFETLMVE